VTSDRGDVVKVASKKIQSQQFLPELSYLNDHIPIEAVYSMLTGSELIDHWAECPIKANHPGDTAASLRFHSNRAQCISDTCDANLSVVDLVQTIHGCALPDAVRWIRQQFPGPVPIGEDDDDDDPVAAEAPRPLIPAQDYDAQCTKAARHLFPGFYRSGIVLTLRICDGPFVGVSLQRFYNIPQDGKIRHGGDYYREWTLANGGEAPHRRDKMSKRKFIGKIFRARVVTVSVDRKQTDLGAVAYSKFGRLLAVVVSNE
jgi:hypothetical protein